MTINFKFINRINKRNSGSEVLQYNEVHVLASGTFITSYLPLNVPLPDYRRIIIRTVPDDDTTKLTEVLSLPVGTNEFYCDFSTGTVTIDATLVGSTVYATYNGPNNPIIGEEYLIPTSDSDGFCRVRLIENPLAFNLSVTPDPRSISVSASNYGTMTETKSLPEVINNPYKFYVEYDVGRIIFNSALVNAHAFVSYYGSGSVVWEEDVRECQDAFDTLDQNIIHTDGSNVMKANLNMGGHSIVTTAGPGTMVVDSINVATHNHTGTGGNGVQLDGEFSITDYSICSINLDSKLVPGHVGAVSTGNLQSASLAGGGVTHVELYSDKASLKQVSNNVLIIGGTTNTTVGINRTPDAGSVAGIEFRTLSVGADTDKIIFHRSYGLEGNAGINIDALTNLNIFTLKNMNIYFRAGSATGTITASMNTATGTVTVNKYVVANDNATPAVVNGKLREYDSVTHTLVPLIPKDTTMFFYNASAPYGWALISSPPDDYALRVVDNAGTDPVPFGPNTGGTPHAVAKGGTAAINFTEWMNSAGKHYHDASHTHPRIWYNPYNPNPPANGYTYGPDRTLTSYEDDDIPGTDFPVEYADIYQMNNHIHSCRGGLIATWFVDVNIYGRGTRTCNYVDLIICKKL